MLLWQIGPDFVHDPELRTEVEVTFTESAPGSTLVELTHHLGGFGARAADMARVFEAPNAWTDTLERMAAVAARG